MPKLRQRFKRYAYSAAPAAVAFILASVTLLAQLSPRLVLNTIGENWRLMSPITALCIAGLSVRALSGSRKRNFSFLALSLVVLTFVSFILISHLLFYRDVVSNGFNLATGLFPSTIGSMSMATAILLATLSIIALAQELRALFFLDLLANIVLLISGGALLGYFYGLTDLSSIYIFDTMALNTALALFLLAISNLLSEPRTMLGRLAYAKTPRAKRIRRTLPYSAVPCLAGKIFLAVNPTSPAACLALAFVAGSL